MENSGSHAAHFSSVWLVFFPLSYIRALRHDEGSIGWKRVDGREMGRGSAGVRKEGGLSFPLILTYRPLQWFHGRAPCRRCSTLGSDRQPSAHRAGSSRRRTAGSTWNRLTASHGYAVSVRPASRRPSASRFSARDCRVPSSGSSPRCRLRTPRSSAAPRRAPALDCPAPLLVLKHGKNCDCNLGKWCIYVEYRQLKLRLQFSILTLIL